MNDTNPNSFDQTIQDAPANPETPIQGTETETTVTNPVPDADPEIDYRTKFAESSREAQRLYEENKRLAEELAAKGTAPVAESPTDEFIPGFHELDADAQANLIAYTEGIARKAKAELEKDPAIRFARETFNERKWEEGFAAVAKKYPELATSKDEFKSKYFNPQSTPDNISTILEDVAKIYLFDKAKDIGIKEAEERATRIDLERATGGERTPQTTRTLEDWNRMAQENPAKFAALSKQFNDDLASGRLK